MPSGAKARFAANVAALEVAARVSEQGRPATAEEQSVLAGWSSWGAIPQVFDEANAEWASEREQLRGLLDEREWDAARRTTINAHYTAPAYVDQMWITLKELGFTGGDVLEPGCGSGTFIGLAPDSARMVGVELDPTTARIAQALYPSAEIHVESFASTRFPAGHFDAALGNVPFSDVALHDPAHNPAGHSMHNHFIIKSLALTRPGGMVAVLTSSYTMDAADPAARREMNGMADLVGAVRLPNGAHRRTAGTEVLTDLLVFQRREDGVPPRDLVWETVTPRELDGTVFRVNNYFDEHPDHVLGELRKGTGPFGDTLEVVNGDLSTVDGQLAVALADVTRLARERGQGFTAVSEETAAARAEYAAAELTDRLDGTIVVRGNEFRIASEGRLVSYAVPKTQAVEVRHLVRLRDGARALLDAEAATDPEDQAGVATLDEQRAALRADYEAYTGKYGPINRYDLVRTGRQVQVMDPLTGDEVIDRATGEPEMQDGYRRNYPGALSRFKPDPHSALVRSLEKFDDANQTAAPATLLTQRVVVPRELKSSAETPSEAVALSLDAAGGVDLELIAQLLGVDQATARDRLGTLVYDDPATGDLVDAPEYLSGDIRTKLDAATEAVAGGDARFRANVEALREVLPDPIGVDEIEARLGAVWISPELHQQFLAEILEDSSVVVENPLPGEWEVKGRRWGVRATNDWGTDRRPATDIAQAVMEQRRIEVFDKIDGPDGKKREVLNPVETQAAQEKAEALQERFSEWAWENPQRASELAEVYNRRFNSIRLRDYTQAGDYLTLPGLAKEWSPRPHQRAAIARMIAEPAVGLFHGVGAGKTLEMICGATEMKRMGLVSKPAIVVPNHMLDQFSREWLQAYPRANILAAGTEDLQKEKRRLFVARAAANDWDAVILTQSAFQSIGLSPDFETRYVQNQLVELRTALEGAKESGSMSVKRIERRLLKKEQQLEKITDRKRDPGVNFQDTGIDYLMVDEAHMYKNLTTESRIADAGITGSNKADDLHMKLEYLRETYGSRVTTMATATPLANAVTEAYVMQRYLRPDLLTAAGVTSFDGWAATFGSQVTDMEMGPAGGFRLKTRFAKFQNVPEMLRMWHVFADVKTPEDLNLPVPLVATNRNGERAPEVVDLEPTPEMEDYIAQIAARAELVAARQVAANEDNMLLISTDGRKAALDLRLVDQYALQTGTVKLDTVADRVLKQWRATRDNSYRDAITKEPSPVKGGLQLVFSDLGTPNETRWDAYNELRRKLIQGGMPPDSIRFMHEAKSDSDKARLFEAARSGHVAVLMGSTAKMGVGTNVQHRVTAMHHVDCPWRPADLEQRDGRGIRQHNQNDEVAIYRYVTKRSFDAYSWQTVARKATFIAQVMKGRLDTREIEDIGDTAMSAAEAKAIASGNPLILEKANAEADYQKLRRQEVAHRRAQAALRQTQHTAQGTVAARTEAIDELRTAAARTVDTSGDAFAMTIGNTHVTERADAAEALARWARSDRMVILATTRHDEPLICGKVAGHDMTVYGSRDPTGRGDHVVGIALAGVPDSLNLTSLAALEGASVGLVRAIENKAAAIGKRIGSYEAEIDEAQRVLADVEPKLDRPFPRAADLEAARVHLDEVNAALAAQAEAENAVKNGGGSGQKAPGGPELTPAQRAALDGSGRGAAVATAVEQSVQTGREAVPADASTAAVSRGDQSQQTAGRRLQ